MNWQIGITGRKNNFDEEIATATSWLRNDGGLP